MKHTIITLALLIVVAMSTTAAPREKHWVATWATAVQKVEPHNLPPAPGLAGTTLRQIVEVSIAGGKVRLELSGQYNTTPTEIRRVTLAQALTQGEKPDINERSTVQLTFDGKPATTTTITNPPPHHRRSF